VANLKERLRIYIRLTRWEDYITFLQFVFGFFLAKNFEVSSDDLVLLGKALFVLAPLLYGGIYTVNNIKDAELDKLNPKKKDRPIPAGEISPNQASWVALILIGSSLLLAPFVHENLLEMVLAFLLVNLFYTLWAKNVPYLSIATNSLTHVFRLLFGMNLAGNMDYAYLAGVLFAAAMGGTAFRYLKEISEGSRAARPVLRFYSSQALWRIFLGALGVLVLFVIFGRFWEKVLGAFFLVWQAVGAFGYYRSKKIKKLVDFAGR